MLSKRQQQVLKCLLKLEVDGGDGYAFKSPVCKGLYNVGGRNGVVDDDVFAHAEHCSALTLYFLADAGLIGFGIGLSRCTPTRTDAALTERGRQLAELLP